VAWIVRDGDVLAAAEVARTRRARGKGLLGRDGIQGALVFTKGRQVHTAGMRFAIDVAFCGRDGTVLHTATMRPWRISRPVLRSCLVIEAEAGAFERWGLRAGDVVEVTGGGET
jgi:uncharacterized membrane protein (UPF0127 family)